MTQIEIARSAALAIAQRHVGRFDHLDEHQLVDQMERAAYQFARKGDQSVAMPLFIAVADLRTAIDQAVA